MKRMVPFFATEGGKIGRVLDSWMNVDNSPEDQFDSRVNEGIELIVKGEFSQACESLKRTLELFREDQVPSEARAEALCHLAGAMVGLGDTQTALVNFKSAFKLDPTLSEVADVHNNIAVRFLSFFRFIFFVRVLCFARLCHD